MGGFAALAGALQGATTGLSNFNTLQNSRIKNQLEQQQMAIQNQRLALEAQLQRLQQNELQWNQGLEGFNVYQQGAQARAGAQMFAQRGALSTDPKERQFWDGAGNLVARGGSFGDVMKMAGEMGYTNEAKQMLQTAQARYYQAKAAGDYVQAQAIANIFPGIDTSGFGMGGGSSMPGYGGAPSAGYGGAPTAGGALGGLGSPIGTTNKYRNTMQRKGDQWYYIDGSGNVYGPIPTTPDSMASAGTP